MCESLLLALSFPFHFPPGLEPFVAAILRDFSSALRALSSAFCAFSLAFSLSLSVLQFFAYDPHLSYVCSPLSLFFSSLSSASCCFFFSFFSSISSAVVLVSNRALGLAFFGSMGVETAGTAKRSTTHHKYDLNEEHLSPWQLIRQCTKHLFVFFHIPLWHSVSCTSLLCLVYHVCLNKSYK